MCKINIKYSGWKKVVDKIIKNNKVMRIEEWYKYTKRKLISDNGKGKKANEFRASYSKPGSASQKFHVYYGHPIYRTIRASTYWPTIQTQWYLTACN